jgi:dihydrodipicolinate synthase/N-acetylneuraminate lyase
MIIQKKYSGIVIPAITPLTEDYKLDHESVEIMFDNFYQNNTLPFILGTTGEGASLSNSVKSAYLKQAGLSKKQGTILYAGISSNCLEESIEYAKEASDCGIDVVAVTTPSYYPLTNEQIYKYFEQLADAIPIPLIIYNIPATTHVSLPLEMVNELSFHENIVGLKDSERNVERLYQSVKFWKNRQDFSHFMGWAALSAEALLLGSDGIIPSTGNFMPAIYQEMQNAIIEGNVEKAKEMQKHSDFFGNLYQGGRTLGESLWALKVLMNECGLCKPIVMPPLQALPEQELFLLLEKFNQSDFSKMAFQSA